ncbi:UNVERIFIED_CONTAM: Myosin-3 [Sesamum radiatum]|uniref:Myosin-3 n=1 Tax=Sesamum radiatum TaxID=300843 RepID=A0AAW2KIQ1_SESRA
MVATNSMGVTRSSLELMLDKIQQRDAQPKDVPPALPVRPVSRAGCRGLGGRCNSTSKGGILQGMLRLFPVCIRAIAFNKIEPCISWVDFRVEEFSALSSVDLSDNSKEKSEGASNVQKWYRGHKVRCYYKEVRRGAIELQSYVLGCQDARRSNGIMHEQMPRTDEAGDSNNLELVADPKDRIQVPYRVLIDLQKQVLRSEAKVREKKEENIALKLRLQEMEKKWQQYEERMKCMEKSWQDQFTYIQKCLAAAKNNPAPGSRRMQCNSSQRHYDQNYDTSTIVSGLPNGGSLDFSMHSIIHYQVDQHDLAYSEDCTEIGHEQVCSKLHPQDELRKLKRKFKTWKRDYKNKLREAQAAFKKLRNSETGRSQKNWWGRLSH